MDQFIEASVVKAKGEQLKTNAAEIKSFVTEISNILDALKGDWQDDAYGQFRTLFEGKKDTLLGFASRLETHGSNAIEHADKMVAGGSAI